MPWPRCEMSLVGLGSAPNGQVPTLETPQLALNGPLVGSRPWTEWATETELLSAQRGPSRAGSSHTGWEPALSCPGSPGLPIRPHSLFPAIPSQCRQMWAQSLFFFLPTPHRPACPVPPVRECLCTEQPRQRHGRHRGEPQVGTFAEPLPGGEHMVGNAWRRWPLAMRRAGLGGAVQFRPFKATRAFPSLSSLALSWPRLGWPDPTGEERRWRAAKGQARRVFVRGLRPCSSF